MNAMKPQFPFHLFPHGTIAVWSIRRERKKNISLEKLCFNWIDFNYFKICL